jgi:hypothetical protein
LSASPSLRHVWIRGHAAHRRTRRYQIVKIKKAGLRTCHTAAPVLNTRPTDHWLSSVRGWAIGTELGGLLGRMIDACPIYPRNETGLGEWYDRHKMRASLAMRSAKCALEFNIEDDAGVTSHLNCFFKLNSSTQCLGIYAHKTG